MQAERNKSFAIFIPHFPGKNFGIHFLKGVLYYEYQNTPIGVLDGFPVLRDV